MAGGGVCGGVLLRGKRHEDLPSGSEKREQGEGVFGGSFSGEKKMRPVGVADLSC